MAGSAWFFYALGASFLWGISYVLSEKLLKQGMTPAFMMFASTALCAPIYLFMAYKFQELKSSWNLIQSQSVNLWILLFMALAIVGGNFLSLLSISEKNATLASFVEISYPLFTFFFAWLLLKEVQLSWETAFGGLLIFAGIAVIYFKS